MPLIATTCLQGIDAATLSAYLDGALTPATTAALREHLPTCAACQGQLADLSAVGSLLRRPAPALESTAA
jgi:anti-sigma factor RsiW